MAKHTYTPQGVCSQEITFEIVAGILRKVKFTGGCDGNLKALGRLVEGMRVEDVLSRLRGIDCDGKGTSCSDQLARALEKQQHGASE